MYIYIHIPFCTTICNYCDFPKLLYNDKYIDRYLNSLEQEIKKRYNLEEVVSIYIGGGTPTSLNPKSLEKLLKLTNIFKKNKQIEFTIESNVESLTEEKIKLLSKYNVNRVSLGVQSFNTTILKDLNRNHNKDLVFKVINNLKKNNIQNISIDLIYGVNEKIDLVSKDIDTFLELDIPHISCYSLIIEDNTLYKINKREYIDEDIEYKMYKLINNKLTKNNYIQYEISNYSKKGYESIHNQNYWNNGSYYGFGVGAVSYLDNQRITNTKNLSKYLNNDYIKSIIYEDEQTRIENDIILSLRMTKGLNLTKFKERHNKNLTDIYNISTLIKEKKLLIKDNYLFINKDYLYMSNEILLHFI